MSEKIAIIGGGNLGTAIAEGLVKSEFCKAADITITKRNTATLDNWSANGVKVSSNNSEAVKSSQIVILAVKPFQISDVIIGLKKNLTAKHIVISVITGVSIVDIMGMIGKPIPIFRAMPNTAIAIQESITCVSHSNATDKQVSYVAGLFEALGKVVMIDDKLMDAATILGSCGTAFALRYIRANIQAGIEIGFDAKTASLIAAQTTKGAAELLLKRGSHPEQEIDKVTTPKGVTILGLNEMEHNGFSSSLIRGVVASYKKIWKD